MSQALRCPSCGAPYKGRVPDWVSYVKCSYCDCVIPVPKKEPPSQPQQIIAISAYATRPPKTFDLSEFSVFMKRKGYDVDPVSGGVKMGSATIYISVDGIVEGPEPSRTRMEKWVSEYMKI
jgi:hypothetical protein